jgi:transcriptional regulator with XRE-family HTH domain
MAKTDNRIAELRNAAGLTQVQLAERIGTNGNTISRLETGKTRLRVDWMEKIAKAIGQKPADLMANGKSHSAVVGIAPEPQEAPASRQLEGTQPRHVQTWECHKCGRVYPVTFSGPCICFEAR